MIGDQGLNDLLGDEENRLAALARSDRTHAEAVSELYWTALSRQPTSEELSAAEALLSSADDDRFVALQDLAWALLNSKGFLFNQ